ncbi:choice-of-anchor B family protein [uncultured Algibacter sp.]|uniref:choice-of-anchor B family protein n=1 Tax=uncultured Algibacter sp. TaxID=298659 RepID=UPI0032173700
MKSRILNKISFALILLIAFQNCSNNDDKGSEETITKCENGFAGIYPCNGYDLLANIPTSRLTSDVSVTLVSVNGNDIWGWTDALNGNEYAIVCTTNSAAFVNITDPINPIILGRIDTETVDNSWRDVKVYKDHAFIVADNAGAHGMQVFDLTRLRNVANPPEVFTPDFVYDGIGSCHNIFINEDEGVAYLVGCDVFSGGPVFIDISNPTNPTQLGAYANDGYSHDAQVVTYNGPDTDYTGKQIYIGSNGNRFGTNKVVILDVTDKTNPAFIADVSYPNPGFAHQGWFTEDMTHFIFGDELDETNNGTNTRTLVFNLTDLDAPVLSSTYLGPTLAVDHNGYVKRDTYYLANYRAGLRVLDISNISAPTNSMIEIGFFDTYPDNDDANFDGVWSVYPYFPSGNIVINDINRGLFIIKKS